jgi:CRP-like cAMP-binding protein
VRKLEYRVALDDSDRGALLALPVSIRTVDRHQYLVREFELASHCSVLISGFAVRSKVVHAGRRQILAIHLKGEALDLQNSLLPLADHSVQMLTNGQVAVIPAEAILSLARDRPSVGHAMWLDTLIDASIFREWIANVGQRDARTRIAHLLCEFALRLKLAGLGERTGYELPMTQEQLADATGMTAVHANRTIRGLERDGFIDRAAPRSIQIGDWRRLAEVGDFDSGYLHLNRAEARLV